MNRRLAGVAIAGVAALAATTGFLANAAEPTDPPAVNTEELLASCESSQVSGGTNEWLVPSSEEDVRESGWPLTAQQAAENTLKSAEFEDIKAEGLKIVEGDTIKVDPINPGDPSADSSTQFVVLDEAGRMVGFMGVDAVGFGAFATMTVERCA